MPKKTHSLIPGADTPEGAARLQKELETRSDIDFRAFRLLSQLEEEGVFTRQTLTKVFRDNGENKADAEEYAKELIDEIQQVFRERRDSDNRVLAAAAGIPA